MSTDDLIESAISRLKAGASLELRGAVARLATASANVLARKMLGLDTTTDERFLKASATNLAAAGHAEAIAATRAAIEELVIGAGLVTSVLV